MVRIVPRLRHLLSSLLPGLLLVVTIAVASILVADVTGTALLGYDRTPISSVMVALIAGAAVANTARPGRKYENGVAFAATRLLKLGVILLGFRLSLHAAASVGLSAIPVVVTTVLVALAVVVIANRIMRVPARLGALIGVGTAICGVSAIVATAPLIQAREEEVGYAVATVTLFGLVATIAYPFLAHLLFDGAPLPVGRWLGTAIHDTSQVTGAALVYRETYGATGTLDTAIVTKLLRNTLMVVLVPAAGLLSARLNRSVSRTAGGAPHLVRRIVAAFPTFVLWFLLLSLLRTLGDSLLTSTGRALWLFEQSHWMGIASVLERSALFLLVSALAGVGLRTDIRTLSSLGFRPIAVGLIAAAAAGLASAAAIFAFS